MDANLDKIAQDLYGKIQTRFPNIRIGDEEANVLSKKQDIPKARFFEFEYEENGDEIGTISVTLDEDEGVVLEVSGDIVAKKHPGAFRFIRSFRQFAKDRLLNYDVKRMGKSNLDKRDYAFRSKVKDDMIMENKLFGTSRISYQDLGEATLIIKHSQPVNPELPAGRTMHIENIYIENALGERFRYPAKHINGARALAEHIKHGGHPYDAIGQHITGLSEELASLRKFKNYVGRQEQLSEAMSDVTSKVMERIEAVKKEIHSLQRPAYYEQFAESFQEQEAQMIPEAVMDDWIDRLTIRTFNEELKSVFPYIYKLVDETQLPVIELNPEDLFAEATDTVEKDEHGNVKSWKHEGDWKKATNKDPRGRVTNMSDKARRETEKKTKQPEDAFENFMNTIVPEDAIDTGPGGIFGQGTRASAIAELNNIFQSELKAGPDDINFGKVKELIPDPEFASRLDQTDPNLDARSAVEAILHDMASDNSLIADLLDSGSLKFGGAGEDNSTSPDVDAAAAAQAPTVPAEPTAQAEPTTPTTPTEPAVAENATDGATSSGGIATVPTSLKAKLIQALECGAGPDTQLDFGNKKMSLMSALQECGIDPASIGMKPKESGIQEIMKSIVGFWNKDATITEGNFTIGPTRVITKIVSGFKNGEYPNATKEDVSRAISMVKKMDPPSEAHGGGDELNRMRKIAGLGHPSMDEDSGDASTEFSQLMKDFQSKHSDADIDALINQFKQGAGPAGMGAPGQQQQTPAPQQSTNSSNQTGTIDGKPASYDDAMAKFRDIAGGMGFDGSSPEAMQKSIQGKLGGMMKGMNMPGIGDDGQFNPQDMMKGIQSKLPQGKVELPGGAGNLDPQAMMKGMMDKMPKNMAGMNEDSELTAMLKIAGIK